MRSRNPMVRCHARNRSGTTCGHWAMHGQSVCYLHGGRSPQALKKAEERMRDLVNPAIGALQRLIQADELGAAKYVLDWAGFKAAVQLESSGDLTVRVVFDDLKLAAPEQHALDGDGTHG